MAEIRREFINAAIYRAVTLTDYNIYNDLIKAYEFQKPIILDDESLTIEEKAEAVKMLTMNHDNSKLLYNIGTKRICENCSLECLATLFCEHCIRNYLKNNFSNWTSGNNDIDNLIQECQMESIRPDQIIEWIPYNNLQDIKYILIS